MIDGVLYTQAGVTRNVVAIDAKSGELLWVWRPERRRAAFRAAPRKTSGRGAAYWSDGAGNERLFVVTPGFYLVALDPDTGRPEPSSARTASSISWSACAARSTTRRASATARRRSSSATSSSSVPRTRSACGRRRRRNLKGDVRGFDVRTGKLLWTFHTIPEAGEFGYDTWLNGSAEYTGNAGVWAAMTADAELGYVYLPAEAPIARHVRRRAARQQSLRHEPRVPRREDRRAGLALPADPSRHLGLGQSDGADPARPRRRRAADQSRRAAHEAGVRLRVRSRDRRAGLADRGAARAADRRAGRVDVADAAVSDEAAAVRSAGRHRSTTSSTSRRSCAPRPSKASRSSALGRCSRRRRSRMRRTARAAR